MRKYCFSVDGISVSIFTDSGRSIAKDEILPLISDGDIAAALSDGRGCDFCVECFDKSNTGPREPSLVLTALSYLFSRVLGYPRMTVDVLLDERKYEIELDDASVRNFSENIGKCKILYTKTANFNDGVEVEARIVNDKNTFAVVLCEDSEVFDEGRLSLLFVTLGRASISSAIAVSYRDCLYIRSVGDALLCEAIRVGVGVIDALGAALADGDYTAVVNARQYSFSIVGKEIVFHSEIKYIL